MRTLFTYLAVGGALVGSTFTASVSPAMAQDVNVPAPLEVGVDAPDFAIPGATRYGVLAEPVRLSDYLGKTVVLAFFFRARTPG